MNEQQSPDVTDREWRGQWQTEKSASDQANAATTDHYHPTAAILEHRPYCPIPQFAKRGQKSAFWGCTLCQFFNIDNKFNVFKECIVSRWQTTSAGCLQLTSSILTQIGHFIKGEPGSRKRRRLITDLTVSTWQDVFWDWGSELNAISTPPMMRKTCMHTCGLTEINQPSQNSVMSWNKYTILRRPYVALFISIKRKLVARSRGPITTILGEGSEAVLTFDINLEPTCSQSYTQGALFENVSL